MQSEISDAAAKVFAREFYCAIAEGNPVDAAVCESRKALFNEDFGQEWATPVLYMRSHEGLLFELQSAAATLVSDTKSGENERAEAERHAAELAEAQRAATAEQERQARERAEHARLAQENAERERLANEHKEAERRAAEKAQEERAAAAAEKERQARESAEQERVKRVQTASESLARSAAASEAPAPLLAPNQTPAKRITSATVPTATPRSHFALWQILLLSIPVAGLILALSWHHLRPHSEESGGLQQPSSRQPQTSGTSLPASPAAKPVTPAASPKPETTPSQRPKPIVAKPTQDAPANPKPAILASNKDTSASASPIAPAPANTQPSAVSAPLRVTEIAQSAKRLEHVSPEYPPLAAQTHITGMVVLDVIIAKDGTVRSVQVTSGHPLLVQSAVDAVKRWRYQPTLVNGQPVEVETAVTVNFTIKDSEPPAQTAFTTTSPCTLGRVDLQDAGTRLVGTVPFTYTGNAQVQTLAILGIPLTADKKQIGEVKLGQSTLEVARGTASFSIEAAPSLSRAVAQGEYVLVVVIVKSTNEMVCSKLVPYRRSW